MKGALGLERSTLIELRNFTPIVYIAFLTLTVLRLAKDFQKSPV